MSQGYDHTFAQAAPAATKSQIQEGYDVNLLRATHPAAPPPKMEYNSFDAEGRGTTKKGIAIIAVAVVVVLAAVIGGAVGGTAGKKSNNGALELPQNNQPRHRHQAIPLLLLLYAHETVEVLTTTLYNDQGVNFTALTLSATIEMFQTDIPSKAFMYHIRSPQLSCLLSKYRETRPRTKARTKQ
ncbi:hypothetical protein DL96DRAFT_1737073 [Flagelloscypha sp. PMI_526]|nr:hypothetical protein DL96DRAFT_1737073 [Flagelloscypha sp. PMI_526]